MLAVAVAASLACLAVAGSASAHRPSVRDAYRMAWPAAERYGMVGAYYSVSNCRRSGHHARRCVIESFRPASDTLCDAYVRIVRRGNWLYRRPWYASDCGWVEHYSTPGNARWKWEWIYNYPLPKQKATPGT